MVDKLAWQPRSVAEPFFFFLSKFLVNLVSSKQGQVSCGLRYDIGPES